ncbi:MULTISPECIES: translation initiation factor IF-2 [unclassified Granulicatella]|uniref:translation initiation factor IF-2 n=1 Tax=unclassified Granulicatella TaxID=2630493 RepID=UPI0010737D5A|nr:MULTISPECIES: translation initiation factor IF-2 [unclassified Granulicatella]MBF0781086.1 translation initiation factor IF-2 [Granulicatella sp. 19428wC4_WM01]TFU92146.1 translation initiation factor IF-2 [Granulicatella sp. WM01]
MSKKRVYEYAKEQGLTSKEVIQKAKQLGIHYQSHMAMMDETDIKKLSQPTQKRETVTKDKNPMVVAEQNKRQSVKPAQSVEKKDVNTKKQQVKTNHEQGQRVQAKGYKQEQKRSQEQRGERVQLNEKRQHTGEQRQNQRHHKQNQKDFSQKDGRSQENMHRSQPRPRPQDNHEKAARQSEFSSSVLAVDEKGRQNRRQNQNNRQTFNRNTDRENVKRPVKRDKNQFHYDEENVRGNRKRGGKKTEVKKAAVPQRKFRELPEKLIYTEGMTVAEISKKIYREPSEIIKKLFLMGVIATLNQSLSADAIELLAADYGIEAEAKVIIDNTDLDSFFEAEIDESTLIERAPVVTIMGHVDHGKTTLLDHLRKSAVTESEAGGITQHIGAYQVDVHGKTVTFLDTPGHAAFSAMRARGADVTDITIIVVAADDGVMPQTIEAINHAKAANLPIIVAVNKIDKPSANPSRVMQELSEQGVIAEAWGGDVPFIEISAKFGQNIDELLEMILLVAEMQELKASSDRLALGTVIEAKLDPSRGAVATLLVQHGTLNVGDPIVVGNTFGRVRTMVNDHGRRVKHAIPSAPVEITGLNEAPQAGDRFVVFADEKTARAAGEERAKKALVEQRNARQHVTLDNLFASLKEGELKEVNVIIKADVQGSAEALVSSLQKIDVEGVRVRIVHSAVGAINESDVTLALASNAIIIGFNVRPTPQAKVQAEAEQVDIRLHQIIYRVIEEIETAMKGLLDPEFEEKIIGQVIVRETYKVSKIGTIAGAYVLEGRIERNCKVRVIRDNIVIHDGNLASLKRFKDDVKEVKLGFECGLMLENFNDIQVDDIIEPYIMVEIERK